MFLISSSRMQVTIFNIWAVGLLAYLHKFFKAIKVSSLREKLLQICTTDSMYFSRNL